MKIVVDGIEIDAVLGETLLEATRRAGIYIPTLCYHEALEGQGRCRLCMVEVSEGHKQSVVAACTYPVQTAIEVKTRTPLIDKIRRNIIMLLYKRASGSPELQRLYEEYSCGPNALQENLEERCILCNLCVKACEEIGCSAISLILRGTDKRVATPYDLAADACVGCGTCARVCPTGAISLVEEGNIRTIWNQSFELTACARCGRYHATRKEIEHLVQRNPQYVPESNLCENCRKRSMAEKLKVFASD